MWLRLHVMAGVASVLFPAVGLTAIQQATVIGTSTGHSVQISGTVDGAPLPTCATTGSTAPNGSVRSPAGSSVVNFEEVGFPSFNIGMLTLEAPILVAEQTLSCALPGFGAGTFQVSVSLSEYVVDVPVLRLNLPGSGDTFETTITVNTTESYRYRFSVNGVVLGEGVATPNSTESRKLVHIEVNDAQYPRLLIDVASELAGSNSWLSPDLVGTVGGHAYRLYMVVIPTLSVALDSDPGPTTTTTTLNGGTTTSTLVGDNDGDGVADHLEASVCLGTTPGAPANPVGCAVEQACPCARPLGRVAWRNAGDYVRCAKAWAREFLSRIDQQATARLARSSRCGARVP